MWRICSRTRSWRSSAIPAAKGGQSTHLSLSLSLSLTHSYTHTYTHTYGGGAASPSVSGWCSARSGGKWEDLVGVVVLALRRMFDNLLKFENRGTESRFGDKSHVGIAGVILHSHVH